ncbi:chemotaxis protein CheX [Dethiothermospora halolimnae]|uniref:chemotaxis protein CheX n=1 Tax=Dethiothermospora halolimnae TaxID=3114390 RepID=UPI003CCBFEFB
MKVEYVNPFLTASKDILVQVGNIALEQKKPFMRKDISLIDSIAVVVGVTGNLKGQIVINFTEETGKKLASNMMGGMPVATLDEMAKSAISELGNMIMGNASTKLFDIGIKTDITPPSILAGKEMVYSIKGQDIMCVPFEFEEETIEINISVKENK